MKQKTKIAYFIAIVMTIGFAMVSFSALAKNDNANNNSAKNNAPKAKTSKADLVKTNTVNNVNVKTDNLTAPVPPQKKIQKKVVNLENFQKPITAIGETNAKVNQKKTKEIVQNLEQVAKQEKSAGNTEVSAQIEQVVQEQTATQAETTTAINQVENRGQLAKFIFGVDFKNLGQLRSSLVHNRNAIRKLTQTLNSITTEVGTLPDGTTNTTVSGTETKDAIVAQLALLEQERQRLRTIIYSQQDSFSLFGWLSKIMSSYVAAPAVDPAETALDTEVQTAIDNSTTTDTTTTTTTTGTTNTAVPATPTDTTTPATNVTPTL